MAKSRKAKDNLAIVEAGSLKDVVAGMQKNKTGIASYEEEELKALSEFEEYMKEIEKLKDAIF